MASLLGSFFHKGGHPVPDLSAVDPLGTAAVGAHSNDAVICGSVGVRKRAGFAIVSVRLFHRQRVNDHQPILLRVEIDAHPEASIYRRAGALVGVFPRYKGTEDLVIPINIEGPQRSRDHFQYGSADHRLARQIFAAVFGGEPIPRWIAVGDSEPPVKEVDDGWILLQVPANVAGQ